MASPRVNDNLSKIDISQSHILPQLQECYYGIYLDINANSILDGSEAEGHCGGFTTLAMYGLWLEFEINNAQELENLDSYTWFHQTLSDLAVWHFLDKDGGFCQLSPDLFNQVDRLTSHVIYYQYPMITGHKQADLFSVLHDTKGRRFYNEYSFAGLFSLASFITPLTIVSGDPPTTFLDAIIHENKIVFISSKRHMSGLIYGRGKYHFYDANNPEGKQSYTHENVLELFKNLFELHELGQQGIHALSISVYDIKRSTQYVYPNPTLLSLALRPTHQNVSDDNYNEATYYALYYAIMIRSCELINFYVDQLLNVDLLKFSLIDNHNTILHYAACFSTVDCIRLLLAKGFKINQGGDCSTTPLIYACLMLQKEIIECLLLNGADPNIPTEGGNTALSIIIKRGELATVKLLISFGADPNLLGNDKRPFHIALMQDRLEIAAYLFSLPQTIIYLSDYERLQELKFLNPTVMFPSLALEAIESGEINSRLDATLFDHLENNRYAASLSYYRK